ncbi:MAG TPA: glutamine--fructose-6-phosphate transaminase (isomerizing) [Gammaproteobacteria bacterium]|nr:glutamine--fructose-6-phosphate transaminase (isomerizing) [Gammaproteobacteria bacterium]
MCGIVGAAANQDVAPILLEGLKRLAYRGYDSAGVAVLNPEDSEIQRIRVEGKVSKLQAALQAHPISGHTGIAHTRWATHGAPLEKNAHPIISHADIAIVHNGIIENHDKFRSSLLEKGYQFTSETDTEVAAHLIHHYLKQHDFLTAVRLVAQQLEGAFALVVLHRGEPGRLIAVRNGPPLAVGLTPHANFVASDSFALLPVTERFMFLKDGDIADVQQENVKIYDEKGQPVDREIHISTQDKSGIDRGGYQNFMLKEIFEQPTAVDNTLEGRITQTKVLDAAFGIDARACFDRIKHVQIAACGTSYHAGMVGRYWLEGLAGIPCQVEIASEFRYRQSVVQPDSLFVVLSQSGETADTLAALRQAKQMGYASTLAICNVAESSLVREADFTLLTRAGAEIGVASTKAFTTQLVALLLLTVALGRRYKLSADMEAKIVRELRSLAVHIQQALTLDKAIADLAKRFVEKQHALFLGRGIEYPIAMEGALKLKELSYIHAEAYPAGELKHGPLALVDESMLVVAVAPQDSLLEKLKSNLQEVRARGGQLIIFGDVDQQFARAEATTLLTMPASGDIIAPIVYTIPLQLLAYHAAVLKGNDVDQPRNLAKSVTVE